MKQKHVHLSDLRGYSRLVVEATLGVTSLVEAMHHSILGLPLPFGPARTPSDTGVHGVFYHSLQKTSGAVYGTVRRITSLVGGGLDLALKQLQPELDHLESTRERAAILSIVNGVLGDHMTQHGNPLTIEMAFRQDGKDLALTQNALTAAIANPKGKILVMLHGHCMNELQWTSQGHNHGTELAAANGFTAMTLLYNTGLHISQNGRSFAQQMEQLVQAWPVPVEEICIVGYSMGGLVARSGFRYGALEQNSWMQQVQKLLFVGTPHHGSMLERAGNLLDVALDASPYSAALSRLGKIRSAGTTDLRYGNLIDEDWSGRDRFAKAADPRHPIALPEGVQCYAIAAMIAKEPSKLQGKLVGDGLVPLTSALGQHREASRALAFPPGHTKVLFGTTHLGLLASKPAFEQLQAWISAPRESTFTP
jgi:pimeloyl-ACP methyl ester carboxylesterase